MKHTPGPWTATPAFCASWDIRNSEGHPMYFLGASTSIEKDTHAANAHLIAAAPELLEALKRVCEQFDGPGLHPDQKDAIELAQYAIAKAENFPERVDDREPQSADDR